VSPLNALNLIDDFLMPLAFAGMIGWNVRKWAARGTLAWWIATDVYFETKHFVIPHFIVLATADALHYPLPLRVVLIGMNILCALLWYVLFSLDNDDPRDRWKKRRAWAKKLVTPKARVRVPVWA
jgi:hypothetical protein